MCSYFGEADLIYACVEHLLCQLEIERELISWICEIGVFVRSELVGEFFIFMVGVFSFVDLYSECLYIYNSQ